MYCTYCISLCSHACYRLTVENSTFSKPNSLPALDLAFPGVFVMSIFLGALGSVSDHFAVAYSILSLHPSVKILCICAI